MKTVRLFAAALSVALALAFAGVAQAQASAPSYEKAGDYAKHSAKYQAYLAKCDSGRMRPALHDEAAKQIEERTPEQIRLQILNCPKPRVFAKQVSTKTAQMYGRDGADVGRPPRSQTHRSRGGNNYAEIRAYLKNYKGPLWNVQGDHLNAYKNKPAPEGSVPCRPPGFTRTVLCHPRDLPEEQPEEQ